MNSVTDLVKTATLSFSAAGIVISSVMLAAKDNHLNDYKNDPDVMNLVYAALPISFIGGVIFVAAIAHSPNSPSKWAWIGSAMSVTGGSLGIAAYVKK